MFNTAVTKIEGSTVNTVKQSSRVTRLEGSAISPSRLAGARSRKVGIIKEETCYYVKGIL